MSRLNYIHSRQRTQSRTFAFIINSWYACLPDLVWQDVGDLLHPNYLQTLKADGREREREGEMERERERGGERPALAYESLLISKNIMYQ